ncbi:MAG: NlpC/P60 family protein [Clostridiaceae bacterium]
MNKSFLSAAIIFIMIFAGTCTPVQADIASDKAKLRQIQAQRDELETEVSKMDNQIESIMLEISRNDAIIAKTQKDIDQIQIDIAKAEEEIEAEQALFESRIRSMYISGTATSNIEILLDSRSLDDLISRAENMKRIMNYNISIINDYKAKKEALDQKKATLAAAKENLLALKTENEAKLADLNKEKAGQNALIAQLKAQESQYGAQIRAAEAAALAASQAAIAKIRKSSTGVAVSRGSAIYSSNAVIAYASNYLGVPYVWGGTSPSGFDCSGFVQYVFAHFRINLPRVASAQQSKGTYVTRDELQPGDLVFFGDPAHHVGIYVGDGCMIHAPHTGDVVKIQKLNSDFSYGRRIN